MFLSKLLRKILFIRKIIECLFVKQDIARTNINAMQLSKHDCPHVSI